MRKVQNKTSRRDGRRPAPAPADVLPATHADLTTSVGRMAELAHKLGMGRTAHALREALAAAGLDLSELVSKNVQEIRSKVEQATSCE
jgi:site-specific recombinase XerC